MKPYVVVWRWKYYLQYIDVLNEGEWDLYVLLLDGWAMLFVMIIV
jgi:hypothetical protein